MALTSSLLPLNAVNHYASSSDSGGSASASVSVSGSGRSGSVRAVTLCRRPGPRAPCLGFSLRGGREHGTGFFVSAVERGSEAYHQGLMVGDQIIRINGLPVEDATHREVLHLVQSQSTVTFKVRSVGMIPVKENYCDSLTWRLVELEPGGASDPPDLRNSGFPNVQLFIDVAPKAKLGCGIMKGPEWKPGIYVQYTKENSIARGAGLKPGDQIIQCNNVVFTPDTPFTEAVSVLRSTGLLELVIQKGVGCDLFPGESSGYNSSASSVAGDQSPETWPSKRLSIVKEESVIDSDSRLTSSEQSRGAGERQKDLDRIVLNNHFSVKPQTTDGACTVIRVGSDLDSFGDSERTSNPKLAEICMVSQQLETKTTTVLVEVHQSEDEDAVNTGNQSDTSICNLTNSSSVSSFSSSGANSLCSAISQELQRRSENRAKEASCGVKPPKVELVKCGMDKEKVEQHQQLMEEFKRAHKKMFAHSLNEGVKTDDPRHLSGLASQSKEERESFRLKRQQKEEQYAANMNQERVLLAVKERDLRLERDKQDMTEADRELTRLVRRQQSSIPPPPPLPPDDIDANAQGSKCTGLSSLQSTLPPMPPFPPACPTPDYDKESLASEQGVKNNRTKISSSHNSTNNSKNGNADFVDMQSLESFKLTNPLVSKPKPPPIYFKPNMNGSTTASSVSNQSLEAPRATVTIREYPKNDERKAPEKFQFLSQGNLNSTANYHTNEALSVRLQDELSQTLSRVNLRSECSVDEKAHHQTRSSGKNTVTISINAQPNSQNKQDISKNKSGKQEPFYLHFNGNSHQKTNHDADHPKEITRKISTTVINPTFSNKNGIKIEDINSKTSVTFNLNQAKDKMDSKIITVIPTNGILKNGVGGNVSQMQIHQSQANRSPCKSIKFAGIITAEAQEPKK